MKMTLSKFFIILIFLEKIFCQTYYPADPFYLLEIEKNLIDKNTDASSLLFRPTFNSQNLNNNWHINARSELFYNSNAPNLENTSDKWIGKGISAFNSINISYINRYFGLVVEPYYFMSQNKEYDEPNRAPKFTVLNDARPHKKRPYSTFGLREMQVFAKINEFGIGWSNANMWWGSGVHSSSSMSNNTSGFGNIFIGTLEEKRVNDWGFNGRYIISKFDKKSSYEPYFIAAIIGATYYSDPIISIGFVREALVGGTHEDVQKDEVTFLSAALSIFKGILIPDDLEQYRKDWSFDDHAGTIYTSLIFKKSKLKVFFELGRSDLSSNLWSLLVYPDHVIATNIGFRKYGLFSNENLFLSMEYFQNKNSRSSHRIQAGDWYIRKQYEFNSYNGRRWAAHSGSDSDDWLFTFGWINDKFSILPSINYERHGLTQPTVDIGEEFLLQEINDLWTEAKLEFRIDLRYTYKNYRFNMYFENELMINLESTGKTRRGQVLWLGVERDLNSDLFKKIKAKYTN
jgi:hypothetical protein